MTAISTAEPTKCSHSGPPATLLGRRHFVRRSSFSLAAWIVAPLRADSVEERIAWIRKRYNEIEAARLAERSIVYEVDGDPLFANLKRYEKDGVLQKAYLLFGESDHRAVEETYYYWQGELVFIYAAHSTWQFTGRLLPSGESETVDAVTEHRIYLDGGRAIRHLIKEASSVNPDEIKALLGKAQNRPWSDPDLVADAQQRGLDVPGIVNRASLRRLFE